jgi:hypothetical protein
MYSSSRSFQPTMSWRFAPKLAFCVAALLPFQAMAKHPPCMGGKGIALKKGGYSGTMQCEGHHANFRFVGRVTGGAASYLIYDYQYESKGAQVYHGGQRLMVFDASGKKYLGQYSLPYVGDTIHLMVDGGALHWHANANTGEKAGVIDFADGPPPHVLVAGDFGNFYK